MKLQTALRSLGYRPMNDKIYAKPFGTSLLAYNLDKNEMITFFKNTIGEDLVWNREVFDKKDFVLNDFLLFIMHFEANTRVNVSQYVIDKPYYFGTKEEIYSDLL